MQTRFEAYLEELTRTPVAQHTELTGRGALQDLLEDFAGEAGGRKVGVQHEPGRQKDKGAPDFAIRHQGRILGYVEVKPIGASLDPVLKSEQIERYVELSGNLLVTNYLEFVWLREGDAAAREIVAFPTDLETRRIHVRPERAEAVASLLQGFLSVAPEGIGSSRDLAQALATRSRLLRDELTRELIRQEKEHREGKLYGLYAVFRDQVFHELTLQEFADAFAQMLAYGLFLARLNAPAETVVTLRNARNHIPGSFRLIRELVDFLEELEKPEYDATRWIVEEILSIVNGLDLAAIHEDLSFRQRRAIDRGLRARDEEEHRLFERDPFMYFYEDYLAAYDKAMRKSRGVYYTPVPVVNFIVRAVDDILKRDFGIAEGLAGHERVTVLDFACGTGTFLLETFERIFENIGGPEAGVAGHVVREHMLRNIYGFEYLIAPYTIAHLKLSQYLADKGHPLEGDERLGVYLTNTLEPVEPQTNLLLPAVSEEVEKAQEVKDKPILVILGNPPYSGHSKNKGEWITKAVAEYKFVWEIDDKGREVKKPLGEKNPKWLQDDYVKFLRFAQWKMDAVEEGVVGVITNHSWIDNPTFRGMRQSLMRTFDQIYVLDLHGNTKKKERTPDGGKDENVFDIEQGVAISLFVKKPGLKRGVWHGDLWGKRIEKYGRLAAETMVSLPWKKVEPRTPFCLFAWQDQRRREEYDSGFSVPDIFPVNSVGIVTARDRLTIHFTKDELMQTVRDFAALDPEIAREKYGLGRDVQDWRVEWAQQDLTNNGPDESFAVPVSYRPFDGRWTYYTGHSRGFICRPRSGVMRHLLRSGNLALITSRLTKGEDFRHVQITDKITEVICMSPKTSNNGFIFPLFIISENSIRTENFSPDFRRWLNARYEHHYSPEEILGYIYAVLHCPAYRKRYAEFLRIDFPRIPFPERAGDFEALSRLGWSLIEAHLLRNAPKRGLAAYHGTGDHVVEKVRYSSKEEAVWINKNQHFAPVPAPVWAFRIGGYQVLDKYLKSRKGRKLSLDEITHLGRIADALAFTIERMERIDEAWRKAFPERT